MVDLDGLYGDAAQSQGRLQAGLCEQAEGSQTSRAQRVEEDSA
jgi:hypothetical protein